MASSDAQSTLPLALVRCALGNLATFDVGGRAVERIAIASDDLAKRLLRLRGETREIGLRLDEGARVRDGDVLYADDERVVALAVVPDDVLVCRPVSLAQALTVAHALGNRHLPMQLDGDALVVRYDRLLETLFAGFGAPYTRESRRLAIPFRHANAPHGHT
ncbi:MAG: urease accessory protein UreE [Candidatus Eremiobacteraeota bacterium]|nr:urease accessory protein UreE [Candidatus Eremiobacteraeota bacterium]